MYLYPEETQVTFWMLEPATLNSQCQVEHLPVSAPCRWVGNLGEEEPSVMTTLCLLSVLLSGLCGLEWQVWS